MKKIAAFVTSALICILVIGLFHFKFSGDLKMNNKEFGTWYNPFKDLASGVVAQNLHGDTMVVFGSSEFRHGRKTLYHPMNMFRNQNISLMTLGGPYNQTLNHATMLGAIAPKIKTKKVVLILSPSWFYKNGVSEDHFGLRFSESAYINFMENPNISKDTKRYVAARTLKLLSKSGSIEGRVARTNRINIDGSKNIFSETAYKIRKRYLRDKDILTVKGVLKTEKIKRLDKYNGHIENAKPLNWDKVLEEAKVNGKFKSNNRFYIKTKDWNLKFRHRFKVAKGIHKNETYLESPEYDDLKAFLQVCNAHGIKPLLVIQAVNGKWYDYTGLTRDKRKIFTTKINEIAAEYDAKVEDFSKYNYKKNFLVDASHPAAPGWVKIDEAIYNYYKEN